MTVKTPLGNRDKQGRFAKGNKASSGRTKGSRNKSTQAALSLMEGQLEKITQSLIDAAVNGDMTAIKIVLDKLIPPCKELPLPNFELPKIESTADMPKVTQRILEAVASGDLLLNQAHSLMQVLNSHAKLLMTAKEQDKKIHVYTHTSPVSTPEALEDYRRAIAGEFEGD